MATTPSFPRNARDYTASLSSLLTRTIAPNHPLVYRILPAGQRAFIELRDRLAPVGRGGAIRISQLIGPAERGAPGSLTTLTYQYLYALGPDPQTGWLVRYEYELLEARENPDYRYPIAHVHVNATSPAYDTYMRRMERKPLGDIHFPTKPISLGEFIELLIVEFHVPTPGRTAEEALQILAEHLRDPR